MASPRIASTTGIAAATGIASATGASTAASPAVSDGNGAEISPARVHVWRVLSMLFALIGIVMALVVIASSAV